MAATLQSERHLEIAHVLFIDMVGYSKLLINEQREVVQELNHVVRKTPQFRKSEAAGKLIPIPVGDGMALVFFQTPEEPVQCAMEIARTLKTHPRLRLRMGVHSGPVDQMKDVNERINVAGTGINTAKRVMDCGDAGHILLSKRVADDLGQDSLWHPHLHQLGEIEVKYGARLGIVNLYTPELGNPQPPERLLKRQVAAQPRIALEDTPAVREKSIAVLPFENLSEEKANEFFADGVHDEILTSLARIADLKVISRASVMHYKSGVARNLQEIAQQLGVAHVVEGSVQRSRNRVRVNAQLVDARSDRLLWAQTYDRDLADVFAIQSEIAETIADQLQARLSPREKNAIKRPPTSDITAFDLYTRAKNLFLTSFAKAGAARTDLLQAADLLNQAVARDPSFFEAYCQLAWAHDGLYFFGFDHTSARLALAEAAIQAAARLHPDAGETHLARARNLYWGYLDYDGALAELQVARQTLPNDPHIFQLTGLIERRQGHWEDSARTLDRAADLDPRNVQTLQQTAFLYVAFRRYPQAESMLTRVLAFEPTDPVTKALRASFELDSSANTRPLHEIVESIRATNPGAMPSIANYWLICALAERDASAAKDALIAFSGDPIILGVENVVANRLFAEGIVARMTNDDAKARSAFTKARLEQAKLIEAQPNYGPALCVLGLIDAGLGRKEEALREGRRAVELLPVEKDAIGGITMIKYLAIIAAWVGDKYLACKQLATAIRRPSPLSYGQLKLLPFWDPLRGDPRFEKIVEEAKQPLALRYHCAE
jgi:TolB-like protein/class 3 adenylate cyclase/Tfp pilus assembly protein PilF